MTKRSREANTGRGLGWLRLLTHDLQEVLRISFKDSGVQIAFERFFALLYVGRQSLTLSAEGFFRILGSLRDCSAIRPRSKRRVIGGSTSGDPRSSDDRSYDERRLCARWLVSRPGDKTNG